MNILLIHGLFGSLSNVELLNAFQPQATVYAPDLPGYGSNREYDTSNLELSDHVSYLVSYLQNHGDTPVHVVGHSVGGAVGLLLASEYPDLVSSYTSVEGNMTLKDAFWSAEIAKTPITKVEEIIEGYKADIPAWLAAADVESTPDHINIAKAWLHNQPASTIKAQANAVVRETAKTEYLQRFGMLNKNGISLHLMAGDKSLSGWDLPENVLAISESMTKVENCGHLMMLENPNLFSKLICAAIQ